MQRTRLALALALPLVAQATIAQTPELRYEDLMVVDCLLPGKVRSLGRNSTFIAPRRAERTTALDCAIRGGEFTQYDRADYSTALKVWLAEADTGNADAQYYVGQIYERGLGTAPDFTLAAQWYAKAALQNHRAAQINLGFLYEKGLGVPADPAAALKWYRRGSGATEDLVVLESDEYRTLVESQGALKSRDDELQRLERELEELRKQEKAPAGEAPRLDGAEITRLRERIASLERDLASRRTRAEPVLPDADAQRIKFGAFHALVIGNANYRYLPDVPSAEASARSMAAVLEQKYGFRVTLLIDASRLDIMKALNRLRETLTERDNLVVFYAGHGKRDVASQRSWWQPVDAEGDSSAFWLPNQVISEHLNLIPARHVLVLADSCYEGGLTRSSVPMIDRGMSPEKRKRYLEELLQRRSRLALTSGADAPLPGDGAGASRFTSALIRSLESQSGAIEASRVYRTLVDSMSSRPGTPAPVFAPIRWASHEGGNFIFVRKGR